MARMGQARCTKRHSGIRLAALPSSERWHAETRAQVWASLSSQERAALGALRVSDRERDVVACAIVEQSQKETAETLLRKLVERREEKYAAASYILAVMLERKRLLKVKSQLREGGRRIFVYEHGPTGDIFTIADPELQLAQLESVQRDVAALLEHGLPGEGTPEEEPFNPPSDVATLAPT